MCRDIYPICHILTRPPPSNYQEDSVAGRWGHIDRRLVEMSSDRSEDAGEIEANDKCLSEASLASGYL